MAARSSPPARVVIGLDVGTTSAKAAAFEPGTAWRRVASREYPLLESTPGRQVQDPATIVAAARAALRECAAAIGHADVLALSLSAGMHGLLALDEHEEPLTDLITWADGRAADVARRLHREGRAPLLHVVTGVPVHPMSPLTKLLWFAEHDRATWLAARWWVGVKELLLLWLTGELATELSSASATGLLDMRTCAWSDDALELCSLEPERLAPILPTTATLPLDDAVASDVGLPARTPVVVGAADGPLANLGIGAIAPGVAALSLGTSGAVRMAVDVPRVDGDGRLFCYALTDDVWVLGGAISNGASVMRWVGRELLPDVRDRGNRTDRADEQLLELAATVAPGSDGLVMLPYLFPERAPLWDPDLTGAYVGLRRHHTRAHLARAALEGVCLQLRLIVDALDAVAPVRSLRATGGAFESRLWRDVVAAVVDRPITVAAATEGTASGAAALALVAVGACSDLAEAAEAVSPTDASGARADTAEAIVVDRELVEAYDRVRRSVVPLIAQLGAVAAAYGRNERTTRGP